MIYKNFNNSIQTLYNNDVHEIPQIEWNLELYENVFNIIKESNDWESFLNYYLKILAHYNSYKTDIWEKIKNPNILLLNQVTPQANYMISSVKFTKVYTTDGNNSNEFFDTTPEDLENLLEQSLEKTFDLKENIFSFNMLRFLFLQNLLNDDVEIDLELFKKVQSSFSSIENLDCLVFSKWIWRNYFLKWYKDANNLPKSTQEIINLDSAMLVLSELIHDKMPNISLILNEPFLPLEAISALPNDTGNYTLVETPFSTNYNIGDKVQINYENGKRIITSIDSNEWTKTVLLFNKITKKDQKILESIPSNYRIEILFPNTVWISYLKDTAPLQWDSLKFSKHLIL
jgi:hypothetical protein